MFRKIWMSFAVMILSFSVFAEDMTHKDTCEGMFAWMEVDEDAADQRWRKLVMDNQDHESFKKYDEAINIRTANMPQHEKNQFAIERFFETLFHTGTSCHIDPTRPIIEVYLEEVENVAESMLTTI